MGKLTEKQLRELKDLEAKQKSKTRWLSQQEFDRIIELRKIRFNIL